MILKMCYYETEFRIYFTAYTFNPHNKQNLSWQQMKILIDKNIAIILYFPSFLQTSLKDVD